MRLQPVAFGGTTRSVPSVRAAACAWGATWADRDTPRAVAGGDCREAPPP